MNKTEFMNRINEDLSSLSEEEKAEALKYYEEYFAEAAQNRENESVDEMAHRIEKEFAALTLSEPASPEPERPVIIETKQSYNSKYGNRDKSLGLLIVLLCTFPIWLPLILGLASGAFGIFMAVLGIAFAVAATAVAGFIMVGAGFMSVGYGIFSLFANTAEALYPIGAGFAAIGLGIITAVVFTKLAAVMFKSQFKFAGWTIRGITKRFSRQGA